MSNLNIIRAWKNEEYRNSLNAAELAALPQNPAGLIELTDADLDLVAGGALARCSKNCATCCTKNATIVVKDPALVPSPLP